MKTKAAVLYEKWPSGIDLAKNNVIKIEELDLDDPKEGEVLVKIMGSGICRSDHHGIEGLYPLPYPIVLGHEAGIRVMQLGPGCRKVKEGDHAIAAWMPACGKCHYCVNGMSAMCVRGAGILSGTMPDGTFRLHKGNQGIGQLHFVGSFSEYAVMHEDSLTVIDKSFPLDIVGIMGCAVPTGVGAAINAAKVTPGSTCMVIGCGGVGTSAIQGCRIAGANKIIAIDHNDAKLKTLAKFGATHTLNNETENVLEAVMEITHGEGVDFSFEAIGTPDTQQLAVESLRKRGMAVFIGLMSDTVSTTKSNPYIQTVFAKTIRGTLYGDCNMSTDIPRFLELYRSGQLLLDEMVTKYYKLEEINEAFDDMMNEKNVRGMIKFD